MNQSDAQGMLIVVCEGSAHRLARLLEVRVDGELRGAVAGSRFTTIDCAPGVHQVEVAVDGTRSQPVSVRVEPGGRVELFAEFARPSSVWAWRAKVLMGLLAAFAIANVLVPGVKESLKPTEPYWGPVFIGLLIVGFVGIYSEMIPFLWKTTSTRPGAFLTLQERLVSMTEEQIRQERIEALVRENENRF